MLKPTTIANLDKALKAELLVMHTYLYLANKMQEMGMTGAQAYFAMRAQAEMTNCSGLQCFYIDMDLKAPLPEVEQISIPVGSMHQGLDVAKDTEEYMLKEYQDYANEAMRSGDMIGLHFFMQKIEQHVRNVGKTRSLLSRYMNNQKDVFEFDKSLQSL